MADIVRAGQYRDGADKKLVDILEKAAGMSGYRVEFKSGLRPGDKREHGKGNALDITLIDASTGKRLPDYQSAETFRIYEQFAQNARGIQRSEYPELDNKFRWGGYFSGPPGKYGALDLMHFDVAGDRIPMGGGSWAKGLTPQQRALFPGAVSIGFNDHPVPPGSVPQVATQNSNSAVPTPASVSPQMAFTRQMNVPAFPSVTPVPSTNPRSLAKPAQSPSGVNDRLATQGIPPLPQMRPPAPGYKMSGKAAAQDERFMLGSAAKNPTTQPRVASLGPMAPIPAQRPGTVTLPTSVVQDTFAALGMPMQPQAPTRVADLYAGILPASPAPRPRVSASDLARGQTATPAIPRPIVSASDMVRGNPASQMPRLPQQVAPVPAPRSSRPADPGLSGNPSMQIGTPGMTPNIPVQRPPTTAPSYIGSGFAQMPVAPVPAVRSAPRPPQTYAGQDTNVPRTITKTVMVANPAYKPPQLAAPGAGLTEAQMRAIRGDMSMVAPKPPVVPQLIPQTITVPNPAYLSAPALPRPSAAPPTPRQPQRVAATNGYIYQLNPNGGFTRVGTSRLPGTSASLQYDIANAPAFQRALQTSSSARGVSSATQQSDWWRQATGQSRSSGDGSGGYSLTR